MLHTAIYINNIAFNNQGITTIILVLSLTCSIDSEKDQQLLNMFINKIKQTYYYPHCNDLLIFNTPCHDKKYVLRSHQYNQLQLLDTLSPTNLDFYNDFQQSIYILGINDLTSAFVFLDKVIKNFNLLNVIPKSTVVYGPDRQNFITDLTAFTKIVLWDDFKEHHLNHVGLPISPLTGIVDFDWHKLDEYYWFLFLKDRSINYLEFNN